MPVNATVLIRTHLTTRDRVQRLTYVRFEHPERPQIKFYGIHYVCANNDEVVAMDTVSYFDDFDTDLAEKTYKYLHRKMVSEDLFTEGDAQIYLTGQTDHPEWLDENELNSWWRDTAPTL